MVPLTAVSGESRYLDAEDRADLAGAHVRHESLEPGAVEQPRAGYRKVLVDDLDLLETEFARSLSERVLKFLALLVLQNLPHRGLSDVDGGTSLSVLITNLLAHRLLLPLPRRRAPRWTEAGRPTP